MAACSSGHARHIASRLHTRQKTNSRWMKEGALLPHSSNESPGKAIRSTIAAHSGTCYQYAVLALGPRKTNKQTDRQTERERERERAREINAPAFLAMAPASTPSWPNPNASFDTYVPMVRPHKITLVPWMRLEGQKAAARARRRSCHTGQLAEAL